MLKYFKFIKIEHTLFSLPVVFSGVFLALSQKPGLSVSWRQYAWILLAVLGARSAGFAVNRIIDKDIDAANPRTRAREIPSGAISVPAGWVFVLISSALYIFSAFQLSPLCFALSPVPLALFLIYPFLKRFTVWAHLGLGVAWGIAPIGGWLALSPQITPWAQLAPALLLGGFSVFWVAGFDVLYAILDKNYDRESGLYSMPAVLGEKDALRASEIFHAAGFLFLGTLVQVYLNHALTFSFLALAGALLVLSHWKVRTRELTPPVIDFAFFKVNAALGFVVLFLVLAGGKAS